MILDMIPPEVIMRTLYKKQVTNVALSKRLTVNDNSNFAFTENST